MNAPRQWIRLYTNTLESAKVQRLPDSLYRFWTNCLLLCGLSGGKLPILSECEFRLRISHRQMIDRLQRLREAGLMEETPDGWTMHEWSDYQYDSDTSAERMRRHRQRQRDVTRAASEQSRADTDTDTEQKPPIPPLKSTEPNPPKTAPIYPPGFHLDEAYGGFQSAYAEWAPHYVKSDFTGPAYHEWKLLDFTQKQAAIAGIKARADRGDDPAFAKSPEKYLRGRESEWGRPARPTPMSAMQRRFNEAMSS